MATVAEARAPALWEAELGNVLWMATRHKVLTIEEAITRLALADSLGILAVPNRTLWQGALVRAHQSGVAVYDTLFCRTCGSGSTATRNIRYRLDQSFPEHRRPACCTHDELLGAQALRSLGEKTTTEGNPG